MEDALQLTTTVPLGLWLDELSHIRLSMRKLMKERCGSTSAFHSRASSHDISPPMVFLLHQLEGKPGGREASGASGRCCRPVEASSAPYPTGFGAPSPISPLHLTGGHGISCHKSGTGASIREL